MLSFFLILNKPSQINALQSFSVSRLSNSLTFFTGRRGSKHEFPVVPGEMATALMVKVTDGCAYLSSGGGAELHSFAATLEKKLQSQSTLHDAIMLSAV